VGKNLEKSIFNVNKIKGGRGGFARGNLAVVEVWAKNSILDCVNLNS